MEWECGANRRQNEAKVMRSAPVWMYSEYMQNTIQNTLPARTAKNKSVKYVHNKCFCTGSSSWPKLSRQAEITTQANCIFKFPPTWHYNDNTVKPVLNGISRDQNIFPLKPGFRLIKVHYIQYKKLNQDMHVFETESNTILVNLFTVYNHWTHANVKLNRRKK